MICSVCLNISNINHTLINTIILPYVGLSWGEICKRVGETFCGFLILHTESMIHLADLRPERQITHVETYEPVAAPYFFSSRGSGLVKFDLYFCASLLYLLMLYYVL